jgi:hypothetical protein
MAVRLIKIEAPSQQGAAMNAHLSRTTLPDGLEACIHTVNAGALDGDFDEARLCLAQLLEKLSDPRVARLRIAADRLMGILGPAGSSPKAGVGHALVGLTEAFEQLKRAE